MPTTVELPNAQTAILRNADELTNRAVKELRRAARKVGVIGQRLRELGIDDLRQTTPEGQTVVDEDEEAERNAKAVAILSSLDDESDSNLDLFQRTCVVVRLIEWSLDRPLPTTPDEVDDLPVAIYNALTRAAADLDLTDTFGMENADDPKADSDS